VKRDLLVTKVPTKRVGPEPFGPGPVGIWLLGFFDEDPLAGYHYPARGLGFDFHGLLWVWLHGFIVDNNDEVGNSTTVRPVPKRKRAGYPGPCKQLALNLR